LKARVFLDEINALAFVISLETFCFKHFSEYFRWGYLSESYLILSVSMNCLKVIKGGEGIQPRCLKSKLATGTTPLSTIILFLSS